MIPRVTPLTLVMLAALAAIGVTDRGRRAEPPHRAELLEAGDVRVRAVRMGEGDTTVVFLHGFGEHLLTWRMILDKIAHHHRVVALDLPGFGASDKPAGPYTNAAMVMRLEAFLERWVDPPVVLVGHSMGGQLAASLALERPELVSRLILIAPSGYRIGLAGVADSPGPLRAGAIGVWEAARAFVTPLHDRAWLAEPPALAEYDPAIDPHFARAARQVLLEFEFDDLRDRFRELTQPTLLIWGRMDPVVPYAVADSILSLIPCGRLTSLDHTLHRPQVERPDTVATLIRQFIVSDAC